MKFRAFYFPEEYLRRPIQHLPLCQFLYYGFPLPTIPEFTPLHNEIILNIKESEVNKVLTFDDLRTTDAQYKVYVIYKNGKVRGYYSGLRDLDQYSEVFKNYKVNDLRVSCKKRGIAGCATVNYKLTLQDGTEKTVTKE